LLRRNFCRRAAVYFAYDIEDARMHRRTAIMCGATTTLLAAALLVAAPAAAVGVGDKAPAFALTTASGETVALEALRGRVVYIDFWASWCGPCRRSFPWMNEMQQKYGTRGLTIVGVNVDKRRADAERFLQDTPAAFAVVYDESGATPASYAVKGMPSSYLVDARGNVAAVEVGFHDGRKDALEERVRALLAAR
jgi:cytochrome c biogenesis protein CcmG/thiol:disulfide interchange protein DsbE